MTHSKKVHKLANAIRTYRGVHNNAMQRKWLVAPQEQAKVRVLVWLYRLGMNLNASMKKINAFQSFPEFKSWLSTL